MNPTPNQNPAPIIPATPTATNPGPSTPSQSTTKPNSATKSKSKPLLISLIICAILAVAGIAFGVFGFIFSNHYSSMVDDLKTMIEEKDKTIASLKNPNETEDPETPNEDDNEEQPTADPYATFAANLTKSPVSVFGYYYHYTGSDNVQRTVLANIDTNGHLKVTDLDDNDKLIAEADNILVAQFIRTGNGGTPYFYLIQKDGKVSRINLSENSDHTATPLSGHTNIVSIIEGSDLYAYLIDIDGNVYKTY